MPYRFNVNRRQNPQFGSGFEPFGTAKPITVSEKLLDAIPGGLAWASLVLVLWAAWKFPMAMLFGAALLSFYTTMRFCFAAIAVLLGLRQVRRWEQRDWEADYQQLAQAALAPLPIEDVYHLVIIPNYQEDMDTMRQSLNRLAQQYHAQEQLIIVLAMEAGEVGAADKGERLRQEFCHLFAQFYVAIHPKGLHKEMQCKSANEAWAAEMAKGRLIQDGYPLGNVVVTTMDADTMWHPDYFRALGVLFATDDNRHLKFWQAPIRYHSNVWETNPFMRILHGYSTCWELAYLAAPWWPALPMSSYSFSFRLLDSVNYWDPDVIADEWHMYIKAFFRRDGEMSVVPIFLPFLGHATGGETVLDSFRQRYEQTLRHAWGAKEIGYTIAQSLQHPQIPLGKRMHLLFRVAHDNLLAGAGGIIITAGVQLPALFHAKQVSEWQTSLPFLSLQLCFVLVFLLSCFFWYVDVKTRPPRPAPMGSTERVQSLLSLPLLPTVTLICVALPVLHSQTRLMLGMPIQFRVTRKGKT